MKTGSINKFILGMIASLLFLNLFFGFFQRQPATAANEPDRIGRYQITSWSAPVGRIYHHYGYYILDTLTGKVVDQKMEVHSMKEAGYE